MLKEAVAVDDTTVEFHMNEPYSIWPYTMAIVGIVPEHAYSDTYGQNPIGSGRYIMKQWDKGQQVIFEANPDYYGEEPKIKKLTVLLWKRTQPLQRLWQDRQMWHIRQLPTVTRKSKDIT